MREDLNLIDISILLDGQPKLQVNCCNTFDRAAKICPLRIKTTDSLYFHYLFFNYEPYSYWQDEDKL